MIETKNKIVSLKDFHCVWCGSPYTFVQKKIESIWSFFQCYECDSRGFFPIGDDLSKIITIFEMNYKKIEKIMGKNYEIPKIKSYLGPLICIFCLEEISKISLTKKNKFYYWGCKHCKSRGYIPIKNFKKWQFVSGILSIK